MAPPPSDAQGLDGDFPVAFPVMSEGGGVTGWPHPPLFKNCQTRSAVTQWEPPSMPAWIAERPGEEKKKRRREEEKKRRREEREPPPHAMGAERPEEKKTEDAAEEMLDENA